jgi:hypothetical protein
MKFKQRPKERESMKSYKYLYYLEEEIFRQREHELQRFQDKCAEQTQEAARNTIHNSQELETI